MPNMSISEAIKILGLKSNYTAEDIKKAFRSKAMACHPDKATGSKVKFQELNDAKEVAETYIGQNKTNSNTQEEQELTGFQLYEIRKGLITALVQASAFEYNGGNALSSLIQSNLMKRYGSDFILPSKLFIVDCKFWRLLRINTEKRITVGMLFVLFADLGIMNFVNNMFISSLSFVIFLLLLAKYSAIKQFLVDLSSNKTKPKFENYFGNGV